MRDDSGLAWGGDGDGGKWRDARDTWDTKAIGLDREIKRRVTNNTQVSGTT